MVTPRLLFELYTFNYQRTLFEKLLNDKIDDALRVINSSQSKGDSSRKSSLFDAQTGLNLDVFIELLNLLDLMVCTNYTVLYGYSRVDNFARVDGPNPEFMVEKY